LIPRLSNSLDTAVIHGFEESDGAHYFIMELVEGETLSESSRCSTHRQRATSS
jgi:hypothetical protein